MLKLFCCCCFTFASELKIVWILTRIISYPLVRVCGQQMLKDFIQRCYWNCTLSFFPLCFFLSAWNLAMSSNSGSVRPEVSSNLCLDVYIFNLCLIYGGFVHRSSWLVCLWLCPCAWVNAWFIDSISYFIFSFHLFPLFFFFYLFFVFFLFHRQLVIWWRVEVGSLSSDFHLYTEIRNKSCVLL